MAAVARSATATASSPPPLLPFLDATAHARQRGPQAGPRSGGAALTRAPLLSRLERLHLAQQAAVPPLHHPHDLQGRAVVVVCVGWCVVCVCVCFGWGRGHGA